MTDRSEESTVEGTSTEELLSETEDLLSEVESGGGSGAGAGGEAADSGTSVSESLRSGLGAGATTERGAGEATAGEDADAGQGVLRRYFDPSSFLASVLLLFAGFYAGGLLVPVPIPFFGGAKNLLGMVLASFVYGLAASHRRYAELALAGLLVGGATSFAGNAWLVALGVGQVLVLVGAGLGLGAGVLGHYLGRDLKAGLTADVGGDGDVPEW